MGHLASAGRSSPNVTLVHTALSDIDGTETLVFSPADKAGRTLSLLGNRPPAAAAQPVEVLLAAWRRAA